MLPVPLAYFANLVSLRVMLAACLSMGQLLSQGLPSDTALPPQPVGISDLLTVSVYNADELSAKVRVDTEGCIRLPMLKNPIPAVDRKPSELEAAVRQAYLAAGILVNPIVSISVLEYASKPVSVIGAVNKPVTFNADQPVGLLEALTRAGGLSEEAGSYLLLSKKARGEDDGVLLTQRILIVDILESAETVSPIRLRGGEEIRVPEAGKIYVVGNLKKPGTYRIPNDHQTSVLKALALSEGLLPNATNQAYIYREVEDGSKVEIPVDLKSLLARKSPDVTLLRNDVLYVPESGKKKATFTPIEKAITFGSATLSGVLIWGLAR